MDKIMRIQMGANPSLSITEEPVGSYQGLGGRAMTSAIVSAEVPPLCHALGQSNKLVISPGFLSGSAAVMSGRLSIGCKSPLTGGIKEANAGGQAAQILAKLGYAAIVIEGKPEDDILYKLTIDLNGAKIETADELKMLGNYDTVEKLKQGYSDNIACLSIGPAGEMKMAAASIACTDIELRPTRHAGRGGVGAVMGSKGLKAIVLDGTGTKMRSPKDSAGFNKANKAFTQGLRRHPVCGEGLPAYGTNVLTNVVNESGAYPAFNFKEGMYDGASKISGEALAQVEEERGGNPTHGCHKGCVIKCSGIYMDKKGNYLTKQPEYETVWAHGGNCGIDDLDTIAMLDRLDDDFGLDTIEMGATVGVAMEAGVIKFGDAEGAIDLIKQVGKGTPLGRILGSGAAVTGKVFGVERVPVVKGQAMPAYDPRACKGIGVTYATSTMGADHTAGYSVTANILSVGGHIDPLKPAGQIELSRNLQVSTAAIDSTGMCLFIAFAILDQEDTFQALIDLINGFNGTDLTADDVTALGQSVLTNERKFNEAAGFTPKHDRIPDYLIKEALPPHNVTFDVTDEELDTVYNW